MFDQLGVKSNVAGGSLANKNKNIYLANKVLVLPRSQLRTMILRISIFLILIVFVMASSDEICHEGECYPRIFDPKEDFQVIKEGQEIPAGRYLVL